VITELRGKGLLVGLKMVPNNRAFLAAARDQHLLLSGCGDNCVRILPPLTLTLAEVDQIVTRVEAACNAFGQARSEAA
jgi:acetylornithine/N-succinyldiaminopimelate aminotransferase